MGLVLGGCGQAIVASDQPDDGVAVASAGREPLLDDLLVEVARRAPGFGGAYLEEGGRLSIYMMESANGALAAAALAEVLGWTEGAPRAVRVLQARFPFEHLKAWHDLLWTGALDLPGVVLSDIDETTNRITIGIADDAARAPVLGLAAQLGLPADAVHVVEMEPVVPAAGLRSEHRPLLGGLQIAFAEAVCTLGFIASRGGVRGFVTNSHCTGPSGVSSTTYYQPDIAPESRIGLGVADPAPYTGGPCPPRRQCRYSDSAFARLDGDVPVAQGSLARIAGAATGSILGQLPIVKRASPPLTGERLHKIGRSTGKTSGAVAATCVNVNVTGSDRTLLCQHFVSAGVAPGDSGSPVFRDGAGGAELAGLLWGSSSGARFVFSPLNQITLGNELGPMHICAPGARC